MYLTSIYKVAVDFYPLVTIAIFKTICAFVTSFCPVINYVVTSLTIATMLKCQYTLYTLFVNIKKNQTSKNTAIPCLCSLLA